MRAAGGTVEDGRVTTDTGGGAPEPQAVIAPLTGAAIFLVVVLAPGEDSAATVRALCADLAGLVACRGIPGSGRAPDLRHRFWCGCVGPDRRYGQASRAPSVQRNKSGTAACRCHRRRRAVPYSRRADGPVLRTGQPDHDPARPRGDRRVRGARLPLLRRPRPDRVRRRHGEPHRGRCRAGDVDRGRGPRVRGRQLRDRAAVPARRGRVERAARRGAGEDHRAHEAVRHRTFRRRKAQLRAQRADTSSPGTTAKR